MISPKLLGIEEFVVFRVVSQIINFSFGACVFNNFAAIKSSVLSGKKIIVPTGIRHWG